MQPNTQSTKVAKIRVTSLSCGACVRRVRHALNEVPGVSVAEVNLDTREASVAFDPGVASAETLVEAIRNCGYGAGIEEEG